MTTQVKSKIAKKITEKEARAQGFCPVCGDKKSAGPHACIVCWNCWHDHPIDPLKYTDLPIQKWLDTYADKELRTFEGRFTVKWWKNDSGHAYSLTIDTKNEETLRAKKRQIKENCLEGEHGIKEFKDKRAHSVVFDLSERK